VFDLVYGLVVFSLPFLQLQLQLSNTVACLLSRCCCTLAITHSSSLSPPYCSLLLGHGNVRVIPHLSLRFLWFGVAWLRLDLWRILRIWGLPLGFTCVGVKHFGNPSFLVGKDIVRGRRNNISFGIQFRRRNDSRVASTT